MRTGELKPAAGSDVLSELACVLESHEFHGSHRACALLAYLVENSLSDRSDRLKERTIGIELFHREAAYDTGRDGIVRVAASDVRKRLAGYYARTAGTRPDHGPRIVLPTGSYVPIFVREDDVPVIKHELPVPPPPEVPAPAPQVKSRAVLFVAIAVLAGLCAVLAVQNWRLRSTAAPPSQLTVLPWSRIAAGREAPIIAVGDLNFALYQQLTKTVIPLGEYPRLKWLEQLSAVLPDAPNIARVPLTAIPHAALASAVSGIFRQDGRPAPLRSARFLHLEDFRAERPIVLIGSAIANPWSSLFSSQLNFRIEYDLANETQWCSNRVPRAGESATYMPTAVSTPVPGIAYALVSLVPNLAKNGYVLIVEGTNIESTEAAGDLLNDFPRLADALRKRGIDPARKVEHLELLMRVQCMNATYSSVEIIADRVNERGNY